MGSVAEHGMLQQWRKAQTDSEQVAGGSEGGLCREGTPTLRTWTSSSDSESSVEGGQGHNQGEFDGSLWHIVATRRRDQIRGQRKGVVTEAFRESNQGPRVTQSPASGLSTPWPCSMVLSSSGQLFSMGDTT